MPAITRMPRILDYTLSVLAVVIAALLAVIDSSNPTLSLMYEVMFFLYLGVLLYLADRRRHSLALFRFCVPALVKLSYPEWEHVPLLYAAVCFVVSAVFILRFIFGF